MDSMYVRVRKILVKILEGMVIVIMGALVIDVVWQVLSRSKYINMPSPWTDELATMLLMWVALLGASVTFQRKGHLGVDYFVDKLKPKNKTLIEFFVYLIISCFAVVVIYGGVRLVTITLITKQVSSSVQIKMGYVYLVLPISGLFILMFALETVVVKFRSLVSQQGKEIE